MDMRASSISSKERGGVAALERGLSILEAFKRGKEILSLAELAGLTGLYKSTILRLCDSLLRFGYVQRMEDGRFRLGAAVFRLRASTRAHSICATPSGRCCAA